MVAKDFCNMASDCILRFMPPPFPERPSFSAHKDLTRLFLLFLILVLESMCLIKASVHGKGWRFLPAELNIGLSTEGNINANLSLGK